MAITEIKSLNANNYVVLLVVVIAAEAAVLVQGQNAHLPRR